MQADNPDGDSIGQRAGTRTILGDMGKRTVFVLRCRNPAVPQLFGGWDRVSKDLPVNSTLPLLVDTSTETLFENLAKTNQRNLVVTKPVIVLDHHAVDATIPYCQSQLQQNRRRYW